MFVLKRRTLLNPQKLTQVRLTSRKMSSTEGGRSRKSSNFEMQFKVRRSGNFGLVKNRWNVGNFIAHKKVLHGHAKILTPSNLKPWFCGKNLIFRLKSELKVRRNENFCLTQKRWNVGNVMAYLLCFHDHAKIRTPSCPKITSKNMDIRGWDLLTHFSHRIWYTINPKLSPSRYFLISYIFYEVNFFEVSPKKTVLSTKWDLKSS